MFKSLFIINILLFSLAVLASDVIPYSVKEIKKGHAGFVELIGPGKMQVNGETIPYEGTKYIRTTNIDSLTSITGTSKGCMLHYSSEGYTENISVTTQSCNELISLMRASN